jgi:hypothetical protein
VTNNVKLSVWIHPDQKTDLDRAHALSGVPLSVIVRDALDDYLTPERLASFEEFHADRQARTPPPYATRKAFARGDVERRPGEGLDCQCCGASTRAPDGACVMKGHLHRRAGAARTEARATAASRRA